MNELRELNVAEMSAVEGGADPLGDFLAQVVAGLTELFTSEVVGPLLDAVKNVFSSIESAIVSFFEGLFSNDP